MSLATLLEWWNFIFALPLAVGGVLLLGLALSGMIDLSGDQADSDAHHADAHADHATDFHGDAGDAHDADVDATTRESFTAMQGTPTTPTAANMASSKRPTPATTTTPPPRNRSGSRR
jgi:hypothetical protein